MNFLKNLYNSVVLVRHLHKTPGGSRSVCHPAVNGVDRVMKLSAFNRARAATTSAGGCNASFDSISLARLGDCETAPGVIQGVLVSMKVGQVPPVGGS